MNDTAQIKYNYLTFDQYICNPTLILTGGYFQRTNVTHFGLIIWSIVV